MYLKAVCCGVGSRVLDWDRDLASGASTSLGAAVVGGPDGVVGRDCGSGVLLGGGREGSVVANGAAFGAGVIDSASRAAELLRERVLEMFRFLAIAEDSRMARLFRMGSSYALGINADSS